MNELETITVELSMDEWRLVRQILQEETDLTNKMRGEIDYILEAVRQAEAVV